MNTNSLSKLGDLNKAASEQSHALIGAAPDKPAGWLAQAWSAYGSGRLHLALQSFSRALEIEPGNETAKSMLERIETEVQLQLRSPYTQSFFELRSRYLDYPRLVSIETTGRCNATCSFCPHGSLSRNKEIMSDELFEKVLEDLRAIPTSLPLTIVPNGVNEPFMDRKMFPRLRRINEVLPAAKLLIFTNLNVVRSGFFDELSKIRNISRINVSFNAANEEEYKSAMGISFERTVNALRELMRHQKRARFVREPVLLSRVADGTDADERYKRDCQSLFNEFVLDRDYSVSVKRAADWLGESANVTSKVEGALPCSQWLALTVHNDGTVPHCCMDASGQFKLGNASETHVLDLYNSPGFRSLRETALRREFASPCHTCSLV